MATPETWLATVIATITAPEDAFSAQSDAWDGSAVITVHHPDHVLTMAQALRDQLQMTYLRDVAGIDEGDQIVVVYLLTDIQTNRHMRLRVSARPPQYDIPSLTPLWSGADWGEREVYDLLGVHFVGHPNLVRIMMSDDWIGHPLRKDYVAHDPEV